MFSGPEYLDADILEHLPREIRRRFHELTRLDTEVQTLTGEVDERVKSFFDNIEGTTESSYNKIVFDSLKEQYRQALEIADKKVLLASQTHALVDGFLKILNDDIQKVKGQLEGKNPGITKLLEERSLNSDYQYQDENQNVQVVPTKRKLLVSSKVVDTVIGGAVEPEFVASSSQEHYCICKQVSFGEMVACDNADCIIEWFHFPCVGITSPPQGEWYCPECSSETTKRHRRHSSL